jgi:deoxyribonuclease-4
MRVRELLDALKGTGRKPLLKYIPKATLPADTKGLFPNAIISQLPHNQKYSLTGLVTEALVLSNEPITSDSIIEEYTKLGLTFDESQVAKIKKSKTTTDYIDKILKTREVLKEKLEEHNGESPYEMLLGQELEYDCLQGHPDAIAGKSVMEVKTTAKLDDDINYYMLQLCAYVALGDGYYTQAILVLPLQQTVIAFDMRLWPKRKFYRDLLVSKAKSIEAVTPEFDMDTYITAKFILESYNIGAHVKKEQTLLKTVQTFESDIPYQIFLGGNQNTRLNIKDVDIAAASEYIYTHNIIVYIHSPHLINLSATSEDNWQKNYMKRLLEYSATLGAKGVVVHTGKHTKDTYEEGIEKMRKSIEEIIPYGTPECPLLLETPAHQGTETLIGQEEFLDFVESFESPNIRACVDSCHVFAGGHDPLEYIKAAHNRGTLNLVHYNDSQDCCGSCKDRHATPGFGKIGIDTMRQIAEFCSANRIDMLVE